MTAAAFRASYSDWKVIKGRKVVQIVFEMPLETSDEAYQALGGMPIAAREVWCGIARLSSASAPTIEEAPRPASTGQAAPAGDGKERRPFTSLPYAQQAGMRCNEPVFWAFLREGAGMTQATDKDTARNAVCQLCQVDSRAELVEGSKAAGRWRWVESSYQAWLTKERAA